jgi:hypothetical protein
MEDSCKLYALGMGKKGPDTWRQESHSGHQEEKGSCPCLQPWPEIIRCPDKTLAITLTELPLLIICQKLNPRHQDWRSVSQSTTISTPLNDPLKTHSPENEEMIRLHVFWLICITDAEQCLNEGWPSNSTLQVNRIGSFRLPDYKVSHPTRPNSIHYHNNL